MSETAKTISGRTYVFDRNCLDFKRFRLTFGEGLAAFELSFRDKTVAVEVGTDGSPRMTDAEGFVRSYQGRWSAPDTFAMRYEIPGTAENGGIEVTFERADATVLFRETSTGIREVIRGRWDREADGETAAEGPSTRVWR